MMIKVYPLLICPGAKAPQEKDEAKSQIRAWEELGYD